MTAFIGMQAQARDERAWIGTWMASPQPLWEADFPLPTNVPFTIWDQTVRMVARVSLGGRQVRATLCNEYGTRPLRIGDAQIALARGGGATVSGSQRQLTFGGKTTASIPPGAKVISDPVDLEIASLTDVAISLYLPEPNALSTFHWDGRQTAYIGAGNQVSADAIRDATTFDARVFLSEILVSATDEARTVVTVGDSITDGNGSTPNTNSRWPDFLAERLASRNVAVLNAGISGARLLQNRMGDNALARFERDVLSQPGMKTVIVLLGINDISWPGSVFAPDVPKARAEDLIGAYRQLIAWAKIHRVRIIGATLTPFEGALEGTPIKGYFSSEKDRIRQDVNAWIRTSGEFDAVIDFDRVTQDPRRPGQLLSEYDSGDRLHPGDDGYRAMAEAIDLPTLLGAP
ncbi:SGNH/GDSL hydrolase family protein [Microvirga sesbaniae]|uniref:SGNH/GDSL hydrolase family protein n=1 Tax=Microvirga sesbaniae TaxID=681392 RepID=UPI0021C7D86F|nr:SGNH/GDSL hydrolase family protein [Microvirga sp. HBU67692]